ncbi:MAG: hydroxymethylbilane synthase [Oscillospiraceae bacterium]|nr:hydroxymethylbilane synthase [Oscillospiraceae bacterium]
MAKLIRIGSRESELAVTQSKIVMDAISQSNPDIELELVLIKTTGDIIQDRSLDDIGGKGLFIKELEYALLNGEVDIAVHSYKDMPYEDNDDLPIVAISEREAPFDALVLPKGVSEMDISKPVGSSSQRRAIQFSRLYEGYDVQPVRGNVQTRLAKLDSGEYGALILAQAGLNRLSLQSRINHVFTPEEMIPSGSQGILAVQGRAGEDYSYLQSFHNTESEIVSKAERQFLKTLGSSCTSPVAVYAKLNGSELNIMGMHVDESGNVKLGNISGAATEAEYLGKQLASQLGVRS